MHIGEILANRGYLRDPRSHQLHHINMADQLASLLIPTDNDYTDAHGDAALEEEYYRLAEKEEGLDWDFEVVPGFFRQDDDETDDLNFNYIHDFGKKREWAEIYTILTELNTNAGPDECYKIIFCARHGQGYHNEMVNKVGIEEWHKKWHRLETDGEIVYAPDPQLTPLGEQQAAENHEAWLREIDLGAPIPHRFIVSPLQRLCRTLQITWNGLRPRTTPVEVDELIRETIGLNLCDKRSPRSVIASRFPDFVLDLNVLEQDELYREDYRESLPEQCIRVNRFLQKLFNADGPGDKVVNQVVSTTSHAGTIRAFITVTHHRRFTISTGGMIPIFIKATKK